jgi:anti-sigma regulatory factor (Ser/Thr protein kinase)
MMGYVFMRFGTDFRPENVDRLREKVGECLQRASFEGSEAFLLLNLMDELICNILEHGEATWVELEVHPDKKILNIILRDDGKDFDAGSSIAAQNSSGEAVVDPSGRHMGLYMVGHIADSWNYKRVDGAVNELNLVVDLEKKREGAADAAH